MIDGNVISNKHLPPSYYQTLKEVGSNFVYELTYLLLLYFIIKFKKKWFVKILLQICNIYFYIFIVFEFLL